MPLLSWLYLDRETAPVPSSSGQQRVRKAATSGGWSRNAACILYEAHARRQPIGLSLVGQFDHVTI